MNVQNILSKVNKKIFSSSNCSVLGLKGISSDLTHTKISSSQNYSNLRKALSAFPARKSHGSDSRGYKSQNFTASMRCRADVKFTTNINDPAFSVFSAASLSKISNSKFSSSRISSSAPSSLLTFPDNLNSAPGNLNSGAYNIKSNEDTNFLLQMINTLINNIDHNRIEIASLKEVTQNLMKEVAYLKQEDQIIFAALSAEQKSQNQQFNKITKH